MKTVAASCLEWLGARGAVERGPARVLVLSGCEENGSAAPWSAADAFDWLERSSCRVRFAIVGERTGELEWMKPAPVVGPVCRENRSWRWLRLVSAERGEAALSALVGLVRGGRETVLGLNRAEVPADEASRQPGLRSGFLCSFAWVPGEGRAALTVERVPGAAAHAAAADVAQPSVLEALSAAFDVARTVAAERGATVDLVGLWIGEDGNFNSVDGSGRLWLSWEGPGLDAVRAAVSALPELRVTAGGEVPAGPDHSIVGLDIRELLEHQGSSRVLRRGPRTSLLLLNGEVEYPREAR